MFLINKENDIFEVKIDCLDDLYVLKQILSKNDLIFLKGQRKIKIDNKQVIKTFYFEIGIKTINLNETNLKINGLILNETEFTQKNQHQSVFLETNSIFKFKKEKFLDFEKKLFEKQLNNKSHLNLLILFDKDSIILCEFSDLNYKILFEQNGLGSKKNFYEIDEFREKYEIIKNYLEKNYSNFLLCSNNFYLESFKKKILEKHKIKLLTQVYSQVSSNEIKNILKTIYDNKLIENLEIQENINLVDKFLKLLEKKDTKINYGFDNILVDLENQKCEIIIITTNFLEKLKFELNESKFESLIKNFEIQKNSNVKIINSKTQSGEIIDGFSGIVCINKY